VKDLQAKGDVNYTIVIPLHETNTQEEKDSMPQCSFTQEFFNENDVPKETIPIEPPWVNVINLSNDYVDNPPRASHICFQPLLQASVIPPQGPSATPITPRNTRIK
jgi:hypothetical protein